MGRNQSHVTCVVSGVMEAYTALWGTALRKCGWLCGERRPGTLYRGDGIGALGE